MSVISDLKGHRELIVGFNEEISTCVKLTTERQRQTETSMVTLKKDMRNVLQMETYRMLIEDSSSMQSAALSIELKLERTMELHRTRLSSVGPEGWITFMVRYSRGGGRLGRFVGYFSI